MTELPELLFDNPVWHALQTRHRHFAVSAGEACRYPAEVAPFAAVASPGAGAWEGLTSLLEPGESVWLMGDGFPPMPELTVTGTLKCWQMVWPEEVEPPGPVIETVRLSDADAGDMVALTDLAFPGFFRRRTHEMGAYLGVRCEGELIAMGGERLMLDGYAEISGVCTHPAHRGQGLGAGVIGELVRRHRREGLVSWLHVGSANHPAIALYLRMGFQKARRVVLSQMSRGA